MGGAVVRRLVRTGHPVSAVGRSAATRAALTDVGARAVAVPGELADAASVVLVCVFTDEQVREVCLAGPLLPRLVPGAVVVLHTTGSPGTAREVADVAARHGVGVVDAPFSGGPHDVETGRVTVFAGGPDDALARVTPVLDEYADPVLHVGPAGAGQAVKLVNNALFAGNLGLLADAVALGASFGVAQPDLLGALSHGSAASRALAAVAGRGSVAAFGATAREFVGKDVRVVRQVTAEAGADLGVLGPAMDRI
jgi:3-hydroxyisobutyrate dehydrogenase-like beta-hydroxyacid dehydrogenase